MGREYQEGRINWITAIAMGLFHVGAIAALFFFSWTNLAVAAIMYFFAINVGIGMAYHRLLTHRGYKTPKWVEYFLTTCGTMALEGGPIFWVATHRVHHQITDKPGDPHSPRDGGFWAHMGWILTGKSFHNKSTELLAYVPDLRKHKFYMWISKYHWVPITTLAVVTLAVGGWSVMMWAVFLRTVVGLHSTWLVNSATHMWGSRRFEIRDDSRNNWWVALLTFGEGWHNNHHAHPTSVRHGLAWYELDITWLQLRALEIIGVIRNLKVAKVNAGLASQSKAA